MGVFGTNLGQSIAGLNQAERAAARDQQAKKTDKVANRRTRPDQPDEVVVSVENVEAVRSLKGNTEEETREDRQQKPGYQQTPKPDEPPRHIDLQG